LYFQDKLEPSAGDELKSSAQHFDENVLDGFARGMLATDAAALVRAHAEDCPTCQLKLDRVRLLREGAEVEIDATPSQPTLHISSSLGVDEVVSPTALLGQMVGEYVVDEILGMGGVGIVYRGRHPLIGRPVAIKVLRAEFATDPLYMKNLLAEARAASTVGHRAIVDIFGFGTLPDGRQYMVMELLTGSALNRIIKKRAPIPYLEQLAYIDAIAAALEAAHEADIVHRDLKPSNLFVQSDPDGSVHIKLLDFGLAWRSNSGDDPSTDALLLGTPCYMSPEQVKGKPVDARSDLYALGVIAYELATGRRPFVGDSMFEIISAQVRKRPGPPSVLAPDIDPTYEKIILRLLAKDPRQRQASARDLRSQLKALKAQIGTSTASTVTQLHRPTRGLSAFIIAGVVAGSSLPIGAAIFARSSANPDPVVAAPSVKLEPADAFTKKRIVVLPEHPTEAGPRVPVTERSVPTPEQPAQAKAGARATPSPVEVGAGATGMTPSKPIESVAGVRTKPPSNPVPGAPTNGALVDRATQLQKRLTQATVPGEDPDAMTTLLLRRARTAAASSKTDADRRQVEKMLDDIARNYLGGP
jgi:serine/threonine-protein kinase